MREIHIDITEAFGKALAEPIEKQGIATIPRGTGLAAMAVADAAPGSPEETAALVRFRELEWGTRDRQRAGDPGACWGCVAA